MTEPRAPYVAGHQVMRVVDCPGCQKPVGFLVYVDGRWWLKIGEFTCDCFRALHTCGCWIEFDPIHGLVVKIRYNWVGG